MMEKPGKKWAKINEVRRRQRRCMLGMLARPVHELSKALRRVAPYVLQDPAVLRKYERSEGHIVYVQVHMQVRHSY